MNQWEEADQAAGSGQHDLLEESVTSSPAEAKPAVDSSFTESDSISNQPFDDEEPVNTVAAISEGETDISDATKDLIQRSLEENERRRQKLQQKKILDNEDEGSPMKDLPSLEEPNISVASDREASVVPTVTPHKDSLENVRVQSEELSSELGSFSALATPADTATAPKIMTAPPNKNASKANMLTPAPDDDVYDGTLPIPFGTANSDITPQMSSFVSTTDTNPRITNRRQSFVPEMSLDMRAIFNSRRSLTASGDKANSYDSISAFSHSVMVTVFKADSDDECCRGRKHWIIFVGFIMTSVVLFAAFLDTDSATLDIYPSPTPSIAPSVVPSIVPSLIPSSAPTVVPSAIPTIMPTRLPSVAPSEAPSTSTPSAMPSTSFPSRAPSTSLVPSGSYQPSVGPSITPVAIPLALPQRHRRRSTNEPSVYVVSSFPVSEPQRQRRSNSAG